MFIELINIKIFFYKLEFNITNNNIIKKIPQKILFNERK